MDKKLLFNDALSSLIEFAAANANHVSTEDIHTFFNDNTNLYISTYRKVK